MSDLVVDASDLQQLQNALTQTLADLEAVRRSWYRMDVDVVGAPPLLTAEATFTSTRTHELASAGSGLAERMDQVERVVPEMREVDSRLGRRAE